MYFDEILTVINKPENAIFKVACTDVDGIDNVKYVVYSPQGREILSIWGCDAVDGLSKKIMENVVFNGILQPKLSHKKHRILFLAISKRYKKEEISNMVLRKDKQNVK